ncbi:MAG: hypothetical protein AABX61_00085 [Nanoarchaeota archaeon]
MHKKADSLLQKQLLFAFYLILAVMAYLIIRGAFSTEAYTQEYLIRDTGLTMDVLHNSPGKVKVEYSSLNDVNLIIKEGFIQIKSLTEVIPKIYAFTRDRNYNRLDYEFEIKNNNLIISKDGNRISMELNK